MKRVFIIAVIAALAAAAYGDWVYEGQWGKSGTGDGDFNDPGGVSVGRSGNVYIGDQLNHRVQYFTATGSFLGKWGKRGTGNGEFVWPNDVFVLPSGKRAYVADGLNDRVQYFRRSDPAVVPESLGKVKALFR